MCKDLITPGPEGAGKYWGWQRGMGAPPMGGLPSQRLSVLSVPPMDREGQDFQDGGLDWH